MQPSGIILEQEQVMLDFIENSGVTQWQWTSESTTLKEIVQQKYIISDCSTGVIIFGDCLNNLSTSNICQVIQNKIKGKSAAYVAINRYFIKCHDLPLELDDDLALALDQLMTYCDQRFKRLHTFEHVDGNHMVAAHPMDCYGFANNFRL